MLSERTRSAMSHAKRVARTFVGIRGIDFGLMYEGGKRSRRSGLRFHFERKRALSEIPAEQIIPKTWGGVPCDVLEASYAPHSGPTARDRVDPIRPGISIGNLSSRTTGTLGAIVRDRISGARCLLGNWHVLAASPAPQPGAPIGQPGPDHFGMDTPPVVAELARSTDPSHGIDAAIARIKDGVAASAKVFGLDIVPGPVKEPALSMRLVKYGAVSELTHAMIDGVEGSFLMDYTRIGDQVRWMDGFRLVPDPDHKEDEISLGGDSGSVWLSQDDHSAVALHVGGEDGLGPLAEYGLAHSMSRVLSLLNVELADQ